MIVQREGPVGAESLLELRQREAGIDGQEGARGIDGFQYHVRSAAAAHSVAQHTQQVAGSS